MVQYPTASQGRTPGSCLPMASGHRDGWRSKQLTSHVVFGEGGSPGGGARQSRAVHPPKECPLAKLELRSPGGPISGLLFPGRTTRHMDVCHHSRDPRLPRNCLAGNKRRKKKVNCLARCGSRIPSRELGPGADTEVFSPFGWGTQPLGYLEFLKALPVAPNSHIHCPSRSIPPSQHQGSPANPGQEGGCRSLVCPSGPRSHSSLTLLCFQQDTLGRTEDKRRRDVRKAFLNRQASWGSEHGMMRVHAGWTELEGTELLQGSALVLPPPGSSLWSPCQKLCSELLAGLAVEFSPVVEGACLLASGRPSAQPPKPVCPEQVPSLF